MNKAEMVQGLLDHMQDQEHNRTALSTTAGPKCGDIKAELNRIRDFDKPFTLEDVKSCRDEIDQLYKNNSRPV